MSSESSRAKMLGFLSVVEHQTLGLFGGYLVLNQAGRPVEFHCTAPVKPSRAQQILYGPTLEPYLYGEQIGLALLSKATTTPPLVLTDIRAVLAVRELVEVPVVLVCSARAAASGPTFSHGDNELSVEGTRLGDQAAALKILERLPTNIDLCEPFGRIHEAIQEAQRVGGKAA